MYEITLTDGNTFETIESGGTFLLPCSYTVSSFTDATGAPGIFNCPEPTGLTLAPSPAVICNGESTTLTASATGAVAYSLNGTDWQPETDFNETPLSTTAYTLYAKTEAGCSVSVANVATVTVGQPGADGEPSTCGCATDIIDCDGTCKTAGTYTTNDGACAGLCNTAYVQQRDQCDVVINATYSTYTSTACKTPYKYTNDGACAGCQIAYIQERDACNAVRNAQWGTYPNSACQPATQPTLTSWCLGGESPGFIYAPASVCQAYCRDNYACGAARYNYAFKSYEGTDYTECKCYRCN
jgi:hypothetical protein